MDVSVKAESELFLRHHVQDDDLVLAVREVVERLYETVGVRCKEVGDDDYEPARRDPLRDVVDDRRRVCLAARLGLVEKLEDAPCLRGRRLRGKVLAYLRVESDEADCVLLAREHVGDAGREISRIVELGELLPVELGRRIAAIGHRPRAVEENRRAEIRLLLVLADVETVLAPEHLPVERSQVVARHVLAMLREFYGIALLGRTVTPGYESGLHRAPEELAARNGSRRLRRQPLHVRWGISFHSSSTVSFHSSSYCDNNYTTIVKSLSHKEPFSSLF